MSKKLTSRLTLGLLVTLIAIEPISANDTTDATSQRSPGDMTIEERRAMMEASSKYDNCVYSQAMTSIGDFQDIRHVADFAMGECQQQLTDLEQLITGWGMPSPYAKSFSNRIRQRTTRKLIPELAIRKAGG